MVKKKIKRIFYDTWKLCEIQIIVSINKFYWNSATLIYLPIYSSFCPELAELNSHDSVCIIFTFSPAVYEVSNFTTSLPTLDVVLLIIAISWVWKWCLIVVLIHIFQMTNDVEHLFICLLAIFLFGEISI